jgi:hypothetical protein
MLGWLPDNLSGVSHFVYWTSAIGLVLAQLAQAAAGRTAPRRGQHALREVVWAVVPALLLVGLGLVSHRAALVDGRPQLALERAADAALARPHTR